MSVYNFKICSNFHIREFSLDFVSLRKTIKISPLLLLNNANSLISLVLDAQPYPMKLSTSFNTSHLPIIRYVGVICFVFFSSMFSNFYQLGKIHTKTYVASAN